MTLKEIETQLLKLSPAQKVRIIQLLSQSLANSWQGKVFKLLSTSVILSTTASCVPFRDESSSVSFSCTVKDSIPTTVAQTSRGEIPVISWKSDFGKEVGYTPATRCEEVSARFQFYYQQRVLNYITTGQKNNQNIICVSSKLGRGCLKDQNQGQLWTLKPEDNASEIIPKVFDLAYLGSSPLDQASGNVLTQQGSQLYLDINKHLEKAPMKEARTIP